MKWMKLILSCVLCITDYTFDDIYRLPGEVVQGKFRTQFNIDDDQLPYLIKDLYYK